MQILLEDITIYQGKKERIWEITRAAFQTTVII